MQTVNIAVTTRDTMLAIGLKHLIRNLFDIKVSVSCPSRGKETSDLANADLIITDEEIIRPLKA